MTDQVWDNVLTSGPFPESSGVSEDELEALRRVSTSIHSTPVAHFPEEHWPLCMRTNGHLVLNGKMSKGTGNFYFSEHISKSVPKEGSIQTALWPDAPVDHQPQPGLNHAAAYIWGTLKSMRDAELAIAKRKAKKGDPTAGIYDPNKPEGMNSFMASSSPPWQDQRVVIAQGAHDATAGTTDDGKDKGKLTKLGLLKDKRIMPFMQMLKVRSSGSHLRYYNLIRLLLLEADCADRC